ncbi:pyridoxamine 5'-phosphate oxidase family protein [Brachybacterium hainanense]|uniref:Pyridoxamine 5'-phosphate oxidase family protein n=1 Tax=Brachybacterium hainanense TaxID=1541174 RepID=A0ABV6RC26_9MICO
MEITDEEWTMVRRMVRRTIRSSLHCSIASLNPDGSPHVTPIGSFLPTEKGRGVYFDAFNAQLAANVDRDARVTIQAVDSGPLMWARSFLKGRFVSPPGLRLVGTVGAQRRSSEQEVERFHRLVGPLLRTRGGALLWRSLPLARDVAVDRVVPIWMGAMTPGVEAPRRQRADPTN